MATSKIEVLGLKDLQASLRQVDRDFPKALRLANKEAAEVIADATRSSFASRGGSAKLVAPTVKAMAQQRNASVKIGGGRTVGGQVALGNEFGAVRYKQFPAFKKGGYSLFPAIKAKRDDVMRVYGNAVDHLARRAFPS